MSGKKIKKLRIFDELLIAFGIHKIIFKGTDDIKHYTLKFSKEGILDIHETMEGKEKKYPRTEKLDLKKFSEAIKETFERELARILEEIDISNPKYKNTEVFIFPKSEAFEEATQVKRKEIMIEKSKLKDMMKDLIVPMKDLQKYDLKVACLLEEGEECAFLYRINGKYFLAKLDDLEALMKKIVEKSKTSGR